MASNLDLIAFSVDIGSKLHLLWCLWFVSQDVPETETTFYLQLCLQVVFGGCVCRLCFLPSKDSRIYLHKILNTKHILGISILLTSFLLRRLRCLTSISLYTSSVISYGLCDAVTFCSRSNPFGLFARVDVIGCRSELNEFSSKVICRFTFLLREAGGPSVKEIAKMYTSVQRKTCKLLQCWLLVTFVMLHTRGTP